MTESRQRTHAGTPINPNMGEGRYQDTLRRFRDKIVAGAELDRDDCNLTGGKYTSASWGLCSCKSVSDYPDVNDHTFPDRIAYDIKHDYEVLLSPREPPEGATCPMDRGVKDPNKHWGGSSSGCFYRCRLFNPVKGTLPLGERVARPPTREEAVRLYDDVIAKREQQHGKKITEDDGEQRWNPSGAIPLDRRAL